MPGEPTLFPRGGSAGILCGHTLTAGFLLTGGAAARPASPRISRLQEYLAYKINAPVGPCRVWNDTVRREGFAELRQLRCLDVQLVSPPLYVLLQCSI